MGVIGDSNLLRWTGGPPAFGTYGGLTNGGGNGVNWGWTGSFRPGVPPAAAAATGSGQSTGSYSSLPGVSPIRDSLERSIQDQLDHPGLSKDVMDQMYLRSSEPLAAREAGAKQALTESATAMGFGASGDLLAGQRDVAGDYSGQRNALRRDIEISGEQDRLNRKENAARIGTSYLDTLRTQNRADAAFDQRNSTGLPGYGRAPAGGYDAAGPTAPPGLSNVFGNWGNRIGGGATATNNLYNFARTGSDFGGNARAGVGFGAPLPGMSRTPAANYNTGNTVSGFGSGNAKKTNFLNMWG